MVGIIGILVVLVNIFLEVPAIIIVRVRLPAVGVPAVLTVIVPMAGIMLVQLITAAMEAIAALVKIRNTTITIVQEQIVLMR